MSELRIGCQGALFGPLIWLLPGSHLPAGSNFVEANFYLMVWGFVLSIALFGRRRA